MSLAEEEEAADGAAEVLLVAAVACPFFLGLAEDFLDSFSTNSDDQTLNAL